MNVWYFIQSNLKKDKKVVLLYVMDSEGSSPGRRGFAMAVNDIGIFEGTIGGGIMEVKLIELAKNRLQNNEFATITKEQFHNKTNSKNQSGLICSGVQKIALITLDKKSLVAITAIIERKKALCISIESDNGLQFWDSEEESPFKNSKYNFENIITLPILKRIHIFGAGHVGTALARQMSFLGYQIIQYDNRPQMAEQEKKTVSFEVKVIDYLRISKNIDLRPADMVVIVTSSYRSDKAVLLQLYKRQIRYIGMMGSEAKIAILKEELISSGVKKKEIQHIFTPIGVNIYSKTAEEIAVSIAAQIILETNKNQPTGRSY